MKKSNQKLGDDLAKYFDKKYGVITYSGTLAIELALKCLNLKENANILVSSEICYSIINTIKKLNYNPIIVVPKDGLILTDEDFSEVIEKQKIDSILLVHQYGILHTIDKQKYKNMGIKIIEDMAQAWNTLKCQDSDMVVTSFGVTKPLSYGIGGGLFFDNSDYYKYFDFCDNESRLQNNLIYSYLYPLCDKINLKKLIKTGNKVVREQRKNSFKYFLELKNRNIEMIANKDNIYSNVWHRFPILLDNYSYNKFINLSKIYKLEYQQKHEVPNYELPSLKNSKIYNLKNNDKQVILLRTRNIEINKQIKNLQKIFDIIEKDR